MKIIDDHGTFGGAGKSDDAHLLDLNRKIEALFAEYKATVSEENAAYDRYKAVEPVKPEALRVQRDDTTLMRFSWGRDYYDCNPAALRDEERFRTMKLVKIRLDTFEEIPEGEEAGEFCVDYALRQVGSDVDVPALERARCIIQAYDNWHAECVAAAERVGYDGFKKGDANCVSDTIYETMREVAQEIFATRARTLDGMRVKVRAFECVNFGNGSDGEIPAFDSLAADLRAIAA